MNILSSEIIHYEKSINSTYLYNLPYEIIYNIINSVDYISYCSLSKTNLYIYNTLYSLNIVRCMNNKKLLSFYIIARQNNNISFCNLCYKACLYYGINIIEKANIFSCRFNIHNNISDYHYFYRILCRNESSSLCLFYKVNNILQFEWIIRNTNEILLKKFNFFDISSNSICSCIKLISLYRPSILTQKQLIYISERGCISIYELLLFKAQFDIDSIVVSALFNSVYNEVDYFMVKDYCDNNIQVYDILMKSPLLLNELCYHLFIDGLSKDILKNYIILNYNIIKYYKLRVWLLNNIDDDHTIDKLVKLCKRKYIDVDKYFFNDLFSDQITNTQLKIKLITKLSSYKLSYMVQIYLNYNYILPNTIDNEDVIKLIMHLNKDEYEDINILYAPIVEKLIRQKNKDVKFNQIKNKLIILMQLWGLSNVTENTIKNLLNTWTSDKIINHKIIGHYFITYISKYISEEFIPIINKYYYLIIPKLILVTESNYLYLLKNSNISYNAFCLLWIYYGNKNYINDIVNKISIQNDSDKLEFLLSLC